MDDIQDKLAALLQDEESMKQLKELAEMMGLPTDGDAQNGTSDLPMGDMPDMGKIMGIMNAVNQAKADDKNICFLESLRPLLQEDRQGKVDKAVKILRLLNILPALREMGGDDFLGLL